MREGFLEMCGISLLGSSFLSSSLSHCEQLSPTMPTCLGTSSLFFCVVSHSVEREIKNQGDILLGASAFTLPRQGGPRNEEA